MMPHDDMPQDAEMIKTVLQKIIDEMNGLESNRIMPESRKPKMVAAQVDIAAKPEEGSPQEESMESPEEESSEMNPEVLKQLMDKAGQADESGAMPEDHADELHPAIADLIRKKKGM